MLARLLKWAVRGDMRCTEQHFKTSFEATKYFVGVVNYTNARREIVL